MFSQDKCNINVPDRKGQGHGKVKCGKSSSHQNPLGGFFFTFFTKILNLRGIAFYELS